VLVLTMVLRRRLRAADQRQQREGECDVSHGWLLRQWVMVRGEPLYRAAIIQQPPEQGDAPSCCRAPTNMKRVARRRPLLPRENPPLSYLRPAAGWAGDADVVVRTILRPSSDCCHNPAVVRRPAHFHRAARPTVRVESPPAAPAGSGASSHQVPPPHA
jgi:hypothetical protein